MIVKFWHKNREVNNICGRPVMIYWNVQSVATEIFENISIFFLITFIPSVSTETRNPEMAIHVNCNWIRSLYFGQRDRNPRFCQDYWNNFNQSFQKWEKKVLSFVKITVTKEKREMQLEAENQISTYEQIKLSKCHQLPYIFRFFEWIYRVTTSNALVISNLRHVN